MRNIKRSIALAVIALAATQAVYATGNDKGNSNGDSNYAAGGNATSGSSAVGIGAGFANATGGMATSNATGGTVSNSGNSHSSSNSASNSGVYGSGNSSSSSAVKNSGNSYNQNSNKNSNTNSATNSGNNSSNSAAASNAGNNSSVSVQGDNVTYQAARIPVATAYAANQYPTAPCVMGASLGFQAVGFGASGSVPIVDSNCQLLEQVRSVAQVLGQQDVAREMMKAIPAYAEALSRIATPSQPKAVASETQGSLDKKEVTVYTDAITRYRLGLPPLAAK